jgi:CTP:molybdopterin cytidylyltransferase MocA
MIIALVILDRTQPFLQNNAPCFARLGELSVLEKLVSTVLRGPFGGTVVALHPDIAETAQEQLHGFAAHPRVLKNFAQGPHSALSEGLSDAVALRQKWEKAMAAAASRFQSAKPGHKNDKDDDDGPGRGGWAEYRGSKDVKIRGLARSFDRDGVIIFRGDHPAMSLELQAQVVDAFGREGADKGAGARPIAQAVYQGERGYPVLLSLDAAKEVAALPPATDFDAWLLQNIQRVQDVASEQWGATAQLRSEEDYAELCKKLKV